MGDPFGPAFLVAADRSVWLLDAFNNRLLVWPPGQPNARPRAVTIPTSPLGSPVDFALGPAGSLYVPWAPRGQPTFG